VREKGRDQPQIGGKSKNKLTKEASTTRESCRNSDPQ
jgi:hypothetical protein